MIHVDENIKIKPLEMSDASEVIALINRNRQYLREWLPWVDSTNTLEDYQKFISYWIYQYTTNKSFQAGIVFGGKIIGVIGFHIIDWSNKKTAIGYWLSEDYQGQGIVSKSTKALLDYGFKDLGLNKIEIKAAVNNQKSRIIPEKLELKYEGIRKQDEWLYDHFHDLAVYYALREEWGKD